MNRCILANWIAALSLIVSTHLHAQEAALLKPMTLELRWAEAAFQADVTQEKGVDLSCSKGKSYLHKTPIVDHGDVASISAHPARMGKHYLLLSLSKDGEAKLAATWAKHSEKPLVILVDGKIVAAMVPMSKLTDSVPVLGNFTADEAARIIEGLSKE